MTPITHLGLEAHWPTFSFYLTAHQCKRNPQIVGSIAGLADAVTIAGPTGPELFRRLRDSGIGVPALFDGLGYMPDKKRLGRVHALSVSWMRARVMNARKITSSLS